MTEGDQAGGLDHAAKLPSVTRLRGGDRVVEDLSLLEQGAERSTCTAQLGDKIRPLLQLEVAQPAADQPVADVADPVAEEVADRLELLRFDESLEGRTIALLQDLDELPNQLLV